MEGGALWNEVIRGKYGEQEDGLGVWKAIRRWSPLVSSRLSFVVGNGMRVKFWKNSWCQDTPLCIAFPTLFVLTDSKSGYWSSCVPGEG